MVIRVGDGICTSWRKKVDFVLVRVTCCMIIFERVAMNDVLSSSLMR